ncbi:hypothetical protein NLG97_g5907 [Lecanicillium saksenae]|uniref:Uncharacterized protein n=1 Tax=Lecanicillium saksenae TaxID=468837 RepID=A0ACC1QRN9_9HYPO|nr:hypothetical protein NLG97_g5907 [Lecanicillium saksenae]
MADYFYAQFLETLAAGCRSTGISIPEGDRVFEQVELATSSGFEPVVAPTTPFQGMEEEALLRDCFNRMAQIDPELADFARSCLGRTGCMDRWLQALCGALCALFRIKPPKLDETMPFLLLLFYIVGAIENKDPSEFDRLHDFNRQQLLRESLVKYPAMD